MASASPEPTPRSAPLPASVIVSTYNAPRWLEKALWGFGCQSVSGFELIVADDGSGEETRALVSRYAGSSRFTLRHVWHEDRGFRKCAILNRAIAAATGDYLIFTDGDCISHPDFVAVHLERAEAGRFLTGACCRLSQAASDGITREDVESGRLFRPAWLVRSGQLFTQLGRRTVLRELGLNRLLDRRSSVEKNHFHGNNASCWRADAVAVNGFDTRLGYGGEDREFGYRLEHRGVRPKVIRYSALTAHLHHERSYRSEAVREVNLALIAEAVRERRGRTLFGVTESGAEADLA